MSGDRWVKSCRTYSNMVIVFIGLRELVLDLIFNDTEMTDCHFQVIKDYTLISATDAGYEGKSTCSHWETRRR